VLSTVSLKKLLFLQSVSGAD